MALLTVLQSSAMPRVWNFVRSVWEHWGVVVTGPIVSVLLGVWSWTGHSVPSWIYWPICLGGLFVAFFKAWKDQVNLVEKLQAEKAKLEWPEDRPKLSFLRWGRAKDESGFTTFEHGFYLANDGGAALDVFVERFEIDATMAASSQAVARIEGGTEGFVLVWIENESPLTKWGLDEALKKVAEEKIDHMQLHYGQLLEVPLSVVYRDFNEIGYRTRTTMRYLHTNGRIDFTAPHQEKG
jgi:hypothetical protein